MMRAFLRARLPRRALALFRRVVRHALPADARTLVFALKAAAASSERGPSSAVGEGVHCVALKWGLVGRSVLVGNALVHFYADHGPLPRARRVFDEMSERDVVSWTTMVDGYARRGLADDAWRLFCRMVVAGGQQPNEVTLVAALSAIGQMGLLALGRMVHRYVADGGVAGSVSLANALIDMFGRFGCVLSAREVFDGMAVKDVYSWTTMVNVYAKCSHLESAAQLFEDMPRRNAVSWSCMIAAYSQANQPEEAVRLFKKMIEESVEPINATLVSVLPACAQLGCLDLASRLFAEMGEKNVVTWNSMVMAHAVHGQSEEVLHLFEQLKGTE